MTSKDSICIRCVYLNCYTNGVIVYGSGRTALHSFCSLGGGLNAGNRKTCSKFKTASEDVIKKRLNTFNI